MQVTRKGSIRNKQLNRQKMLQHNHTVRGTAFSSASRPVCRWGVVSSHKVRRHYDTTRTSRRAATLRPQYKRANDPRHPVCPTHERPATQSARNNASVGAPGCRTPRHQLNAQFTTCYRCYAMPSSSKKPLIRACLLLAFTAAWQHSALSTLSQTYPANCYVFIFQNPLTNRHQLLQPLNLSHHCPHSLCNAVNRQHLPRKPRRGTGRLATTPDTKIRTAKVSGRKKELIFIWARVVVMT